MQTDSAQKKKPFEFNQQQREALEERHGTLAVDDTPSYRILEHQGCEVAVRYPVPSAAWRKFMRFADDARRKPEAMAQLTKDCLVSDTDQRSDALKRFDSMLEFKPGLGETFGASICDLAGLSPNAEKSLGKTE